MKELKDIILEHSEKGNIVISDIEGLRAYNLGDFIDQPIDGLLYDLNRSEEVVLTFIDDKKWVNDFAVCKVIRALKSKIEDLENELEDKLERS